MDEIQKQTLKKLLKQGHKAQAIRLMFQWIKTGVAKVRDFEDFISDVEDQVISRI